MISFKDFVNNLAEDQASIDYKVNPRTGRKYRAHRITFKNSGAHASKPKGKYDRDDEEEPSTSKEA